MSDLECTVLEAMADSLLPRKSGERLALTDSTIRMAWSKEGLERVLVGIAGVDSSTISNLVALRSRRVASCRQLPSGAPLVIVPDSAFAALAGVFDERWRSFQAAFPQTRGLASISSVGFSDDKRQALLHLTHLCGSLCGYGSIVLLEQGQDGRWRVRLSRVLAVS